jgi:hypothetical protein
MRRPATTSADEYIRRIDRMLVITGSAVIVLAVCLIAQIP